MFVHVWIYLTRGCDTHFSRTCLIITVQLIKGTEGMSCYQHCITTRRSIPDSLRTHFTSGSRVLFRTKYGVKSLFLKLQGGSHFYKIDENFVANITM